MADQNKVLSEILDTLSSEETASLDKFATVGAYSLTDTENPEVKKKLPIDKPSIHEGRTGLSALSKNRYQDDYRNFNNVEPNRHIQGSTENIAVPNAKVEPGLYFEKKASSDVLAVLSEAVGIDLQKTASYDDQEDMLLKVAEEVLVNELDDLVKEAQVLGQIAAEAFISALDS